MKVGVAGAGIMGSLLAYTLMKLGHVVTVYDKGTENNCSNAAAGLLTPIAELETNDPIIFAMGMASLKKHWPRILKQLDSNIYFRHEGSVVVAHALDVVELTHFANKVTAKKPNESLYQAVNQAELAVLEPELSGFKQGYYIRDEGQIDNQHLLQVMQQRMSEGGVIFKNENVLSVTSGNVQTHDSNNNFDLVCDCRGMGASDDVRGVRGELIWLWAPDIEISRPIRLLHPRFKLYISPRPNNIYLLGASEIESEDMTNISVRSMLELLTAAYSIHPKFAEARIIKTVTHVRPTLPDNLPRIKYADGYVEINGLYRHGFMIAPALVADVVEWVNS